MENDTIMVPAAGRLLEGIKKRQLIQKLKADGLSNPQICGQLNISSQALNRHLQVIRAESEKQSA